MISGAKSRVMSSLARTRILIFNDGLTLWGWPVSFDYGRITYILKAEHLYRWARLTRALSLALFCYPAEGGRALTRPPFIRYAPSPSESADGCQSFGTVEISAISAVERVPDRFRSYTLSFRRRIAIGTNRNVLSPNALSRSYATRFCL